MSGSEVCCPRRDGASPILSRHCCRPSHPSARTRDWADSLKTSLELSISRPLRTTLVHDSYDPKGAVFQCVSSVDVQIAPPSFPIPFRCQSSKFGSLFEMGDSSFHRLAFALARTNYRLQSDQAFLSPRHPKSASCPVSFSIVATSNLHVATVTRGLSFRAPLQSRQAGTTKFVQTSAVHQPT
jgi:hypothetical protein